MLLIDDAQKAQFKNVWILAEAYGGRLMPATFELISAAKNLAGARGSEVYAVLLGSGVQGVEALFEYGADRVILVEDPRLAGFNDELESRVVKRLIEKYRPEILLGAATARGRAVIPRIAVQCETGLTADCTQLSVDPATGDLLQTRPAFGGNILATIRTPRHRPQMATFRPHVMKAREPVPGRRGELIAERVEPGDAGNIKEILQTIRSAESTVALGDAEIIVAGGRAMKGAKGFELLRALAEKLGAAVGASRPCIDSGWVSYPHQVGQTGQTVQAKLYMAFGISGQIQHLVGMQSCEHIVAVDLNPSTPLMQMADVAVTGDAFKIIPELIAGLA
jgi:electron transfer flavoprotein alpha subunit